MTHRSFFTQLSLLAGGVGLLLFGFGYIPSLQVHQGFSWITWLMYVLLSIVMYFAAFRAANSSNANNFHMTAISFIVGKMVLSVFLIVFYVKFMKPESRGFLIPFLIIYLCFSIFEYYAMIRLGKIEKKQSPSE